AAGALGTCLVLLPLHGGIGMAFLPGLAAWALYAAGRRWRAGSVSERRRCALLAACALVALALVGAYLRGFVRPADHPQSPSVAASVRCALEVLSMSVGPAGAQAWPVSGLAAAALLAATLGF